jgi:hypothetical protein
MSFYHRQLVYNALESGTRFNKEPSMNKTLGVLLVLVLGAVVLGQCRTAAG